MEPMNITETNGAARIGTPPQIEFTGVLGQNGRYTKECKLNVVSWIKTNGLTLIAAQQMLGIPNSTLSVWCKKYGRKFKAQTNGQKEQNDSFEYCRYDREFKMKCVAWMDANPNASLSEASAALGVSDSSLSRWRSVSKYHAKKPAGPTGFDTVKTPYAHAPFTYTHVPSPTKPVSSDLEVVKAMLNTALTIINRM